MSKILIRHLMRFFVYVLEAMQRPSHTEHTEDKNKTVISTALHLIRKLHLI